jgi:hypothetical protein
VQQLPFAIADAEGLQRARLAAAELGEALPRCLPMWNAIMRSASARLFSVIAVMPVILKNVFSSFAIVPARASATSNRAVTPRSRPRMPVCSSSATSRLAEPSAPWK